jgi:hypothetical protein
MHSRGKSNAVPFFLVNLQKEDFTRPLQEGRTSPISDMQNYIISLKKRL